MWWYLVLTDLFVMRSWAFAEVPFGKNLPIETFVLVPNFLPNTAQVPNGASATPQESSTWDRPDIVPSKKIPHFVVKPDQTITTAEGLCLAASASVVRARQCDGSASQLWSLVPRSQGRNYQMRVKHVLSRKCLHVDTTAAFNSAPIELRRCENDQTTAWSFQEAYAPPTRWPSHGLPFSSGHALIPLIILAGFGAIVFSTWQYQRTAQVETLGQSGLASSVGPGGICLTAHSSMHPGGASFTPTFSMSGKLVPAVMALSSGATDALTATYKMSARRDDCNVNIQLDGSHCSASSIDIRSSPRTLQSQSLISGYTMKGMSVLMRARPLMKTSTALGHESQNTASTSWTGAFGAEGLEIKPGSKTLICGVDIKQNKYKTLQNSWTIESSLDELEQLCETAGLEVVSRDFQNMQHPSASTFVGPGKLEEIMQTVVSKGIKTVVFDDELKPAQGRNLQTRLGDNVQILDRTTVILFIFGQRARTKEAQLQVSVAQMRYMLPRLSMFLTEGAGLDATGGSAKGGAYLKGAGESQLELDRRLFRKQIGQLEAEIDKVQAKRELYRQQRRERDRLPIIAICGYTNAGKSTLLNKLIGSAEIYADDLLFATLDNTTRKVLLPSSKEVLMTDTIGFIQKLPTRLVASFRATIEEVSDATVVIHVVDVSSPLATQQVCSVQEIITDLGANGTPQILVLNKIDKLVGNENTDIVEPKRDADTYWQSLDDNVSPCEVVETSALDGSGLQKLLGAIEHVLSQLNQKVRCVIPYDKGALLGEMYKSATIESVESKEDGTHIVASVPESLGNRLSKEAKAYGAGMSVDFETSARVVTGQLVDE